MNAAQLPAAARGVPLPLSSALSGVERNPETGNNTKRMQTMRINIESAEPITCKQHPLGEMDEFSITRIQKQQNRRRG
ncbi:hypothetical protein Y1Q_0014217 [Alligator mississippiensis]|uniref:Uncharacterized protein n=1 Tax=Alligator mississippiensis TaxID=8496 RepID=A0A151MUA3_ALLMI|nr:hypothetical protein Y1Q_0014217 [Alligator mississippiensis]